MSQMPFSTFAISGKAGAGKTTAAIGLCGDATRVQTKQGNNIIEWDQMALAAPIKEVLSIKKNLIKEKDRRLYQIHSIVSGLYSDSPLYGAPPYADLVKLVHEIDAMELGSYSDNYRKFQQKMGDAIRSIDPDAFNKTLYNKALSKVGEIKKMTEECELQGLDYHRVLLISDMRFDNEAQFFKDKFGVRIYGLRASKNVRQARLAARDGGIITKKESKHKSENGIDKKYVDLTINTDIIDESSVINTIKQDIYKELGI